MDTGGSRDQPPQPPPGEGEGPRSPAPLPRSCTPSGGNLLPESPPKGKSRERTSSNPPQVTWPGPQVTMPGGTSSPAAQTPAGPLRVPEAPAQGGGATGSTHFPSLAGPGWKTRSWGDITGTSEPQAPSQQEGLERQALPQPEGKQTSTPTLIPFPIFPRASTFLGGLPCEGPEGTGYLVPYLPPLGPGELGGLEGIRGA